MPCFAVSGRPRHECKLLHVLSDISYVEKQSVFHRYTTGLDWGACDRPWPAHSPVASRCHSSMCSDRMNGVQALVQQTLEVSVNVDLKVAKCQPVNPPPLGWFCSKHLLQSLVPLHIMFPMPSTLSHKVWYVSSRHVSTIKHTVLTTCRQTGNFGKDAITASPAQPLLAT